MLSDIPIEILAGTLPDINSSIGEPFNDTACGLLTDLSAMLMRNKEAKQQADVIAFAFWCRKSQIARLKEDYVDKYTRMGRGTAFHVCPSNVPVNAFYSFAFGLLAGNRNIVRLPSKGSMSIDIILKALNDLLSEKKYCDLARSNVFIRYDSTTEATLKLSALCDARIIWGGDNTIAKIRKSPIPARTHEITFADRYSFAVIDAASVGRLTESDLKKLAVAFFNDTLQMDQNACSSPHLIIWLNGTEREAKTRFWHALKNYTEQRYALESTQSVDRYTRMLSGFITGPDQHLLTNLAESIQRVHLQYLPADVDRMRGVYGLFYEYDAVDVSEVAHIVNKKYQTLTYYGLDTKVLSEFVTKNRLSGIDRIVPIGDALNIDTIWDGHDVLRELTRIIDVR